MKEKYDVTMNRVPMDIDQVLSQLAGEVQAEEQQHADKQKVEQSFLHSIFLLK